MTKFFITFLSLSMFGGLILAYDSQYVVQIKSEIVRATPELSEIDPVLGTKLNTVLSHISQYETLAEKCSEEQEMADTSCTVATNPFMGSFMDGIAGLVGQGLDSMMGACQKYTKMMLGGKAALESFKVGCLKQKNACEDVCNEAISKMGIIKKQVAEINMALVQLNIKKTEQAVSYHISEEKLIEISNQHMNDCMLKSKYKTSGFDKISNCKKETEQWLVTIKKIVSDVVAKEGDEANNKSKTITAEIENHNELRLRLAGLEPALESEEEENPIATKKICADKTQIILQASQGVAQALVGVATGSTCAKELSAAFPDMKYNASCLQAGTCSTSDKDFDVCQNPSFKDSSYCNGKSQERFTGNNLNKNLSKDSESSASTANMNLSPGSNGSGSENIDSKTTGTISPKILSEGKLQNALPSTTEGRSLAPTAKGIYPSLEAISGATVTAASGKPTAARSPSSLYDGNIGDLNVSAGSGLNSYSNSSTNPMDEERKLKEKLEDTRRQMNNQQLYDIQPSYSGSIFEAVNRAYKRTSGILPYP